MRSDHGSVSTYSNYGCRCADCRAANAAAQRRWVAGDRTVPTAPCSVDGCDRIDYARGLCALHYKRNNKTGDVGPPGLMVRPEAVCGTISRYTNHKCRCAACRQARARYARRRLGQKKQFTDSPFEVALRRDTTVVRTEDELRQALTTGRVFAALPAGRQP